MSYFVASKIIFGRVQILIWSKQQIYLQIPDFRSSASTFFVAARLVFEAFLFHRLCKQQREILYTFADYVQFEYQSSFKDRGSEDSRVPLVGTNYPLFKKMTI